jgi:undecaprenyl-diphosphatase
MREANADDFHYCLKILVASIPLGIVGLSLKVTIESMYDANPMIIVGLGLLVTATCLYLVRNASGVNGRQTVSYKDAMFIGAGQMFAVLPGLSRSGITTSAGLSRKMSMETTLVFSFMIYIPASIGSSLYYAWETIRDPDTLGFDPANMNQYIYYGLALVASLVATRFSLKFIFRLFRRGKLIYFSLYTFAVGMLALLAGILAL